MSGRPIKRILRGARLNPMDSPDLCGEFGEGQVGAAMRPSKHECSTHNE